MTSATLCPSPPVALVLSMWLSVSRSLSRVMWWAHEVHVSFGSLRAFAVLLARAVATVDVLPGAVSSMFPLTV